MMRHCYVSRLRPPSLAKYFTRNGWHMYNLVSLVRAAAAPCFLALLDCYYCYPPLLLNWLCSFSLLSGLAFRP